MNKSTLIFRILQQLHLSLKEFEFRLWERYGGYPPLGPALAVHGPAITDDSWQGNGGGIASIFNGFLLAVPKHRRSIQRNRTRRRAMEKMVKYIPKEKFTTCEVCGHTKMIGLLCGHCLIRIRQETAEIREKLFSQEEETQTLPDRERVIFYEDDTLRLEDAGKQIVEMKKKRPSWFSRALLE